MLSIEKFRGYSTEVKERIERREILLLRSNVKEEEYFTRYTGG